MPFAALFLRLASRAHEKFPIEPLTFVVAMLGLAFVLHEPWFFGAVAILTLGDGIATIIGLRWGRRKLAWNPRKSWEGLCAGSLVASVSAVAFAALGKWWHDAGYEHDPLLGIHSGLFVGLMGALFVVAAATVRGLTASRPQWRVPNSPLPVTGAVLLASLAVAALPLLLAPVVGVHGPLVPYDLLARPDGELYARFAVGGVLAMLVESFIRRHDNLIVPLVGLVPVVVL